MSRQLISRNPDLARLLNEGYELEFRDGLLLVHAVPYVTPERTLALGTIVSELTLRSPDVVDKPGSHQVHFIGQHPCFSDGRVLAPIQHSTAQFQLAPGVLAQHHFSNKPRRGYYEDYYEKITTYVRVISDQARVLNAAADARTWKLVRFEDGQSVFHYEDTASGRAGVGALAARLAPHKVAIVGLGGTGSYVLDLVSRTHVARIHLFDGDALRQHNAFRSPGAISGETLDRHLLKVEWLAEHYGAMRKGIEAHPVMIDETNAAELTQFDHVFLCVDKGSVRGMVVDALAGSATALIDVGMGMGLTPEGDRMWGTCRVTTSTPTTRVEAAATIPRGDRDDELYRSNIQVIELNAINAAQAVIRWKRLCGYYCDDVGEVESTFVVGLNQMGNKGGQS